MITTGAADLIPAIAGDPAAAGAVAHVGGAITGAPEETGAAETGDP